jgi:hypothetical protein
VGGTKFLGRPGENVVIIAIAMFRLEDFPERSGVRPVYRVMCRMFAK